ncbi:MAG TPA: 3-carboxy-cis,cis-muconate cycloisomerase [Candidatus Methylomirabilis sp.]|nr:3-carboxy-cis,cis-muconate cycloisomerase [Candidatus Methylomirabilis sp.]
MNLLDPLFRSQHVERVFSNRATLQGMLDFEAALARAEARAGFIPESAAPAIESKCRAELYDMALLARSAATAGNLAIPLVKQLTHRVAQKDKEAARYVHWGATSQDTIDTGRVLQLRQALALISAELDHLATLLSVMAHKHRASVVAARTWMQQALPTTFGLKAAGWLDAINRHRARLAETRERCLVLQFGGAVGTMAALGARGIDVAFHLSKELQLPSPAVPWHSHRDRMAEVATTLGLCTGTLGKIARDISLHTQTEVAELFEPSVDGRGGSSTMPHKHNPVTSAVVLAAASRVPALVATMLSSVVQEQERGLGGWHAEWETLPEIVRLTAGALHHLTSTVSGLDIDAARMRQNLDVTHGLIFAEAVSMALAEKMPRAEAHELVRLACKRAHVEHAELRSILASDGIIRANLSNAELDRLFTPANYLGVADQLIDRVLGAGASPREQKKSRSK